MRVQIVGIVPQDYKLDNGYEFKGDKIHAIDLETKAPNQAGCQVMDFKIAADHPLANVPLKIDGVYAIYFDKKGRLDFIQEVKS